MLVYLSTNYFTQHHTAAFLVVGADQVKRLLLLAVSCAENRRPVTKHTHVCLSVMLHWLFVSAGAASVQNDEKALAGQ